MKPPFRLLVRAINPDGSPAGHIRFAVSEAFVVRTFGRTLPQPRCAPPAVRSRPPAIRVAALLLHEAAEGQEEFRMGARQFARLSVAPA